jgi:hypothetical protein
LGVAWHLFPFSRRPEARGRLVSISLRTAVSHTGEDLYTVIITVKVRWPSGSSFGLALG